MTGVQEGPEVCESGLWVDSSTGQVVDSAPDGPGVQLVPPGALLTAERVAEVEAARAAAPPVVVESVTDPVPEKAPAAKKTPAKKV